MGANNTEPWELEGFTDTLEITRDDDDTKYGRAHIVITISRLQTPDRAVSSERGTQKHEFFFNVGSARCSYIRETMNFTCTSDDLAPEAPKSEIIRRRQVWEYYGNETEVSF